MIHLFIGNVGHFFIILSFVLSLVAAFSYFKASQDSTSKKKYWITNGRFLFWGHSLSAVAVIVVLFIIIYNNYFEYHYAYSHSSKYLPIHYIISCFWEGQEGSFLLWVFWNSLLGIILIQISKSWDAPVMMIFALVQAFLTSTILGVMVFDIKIGSSPFMLLRDVINDPIFEINPEFVPKDGTGLNPLLQNYWMVIHPPTLFLGYATTLIPFAYVIAGLWKKRYTDWIKPVLPWTIFSTALMALGQLMGAYWAYETLSFGGYWNWDPVENAVYIPWIIQVASIHTMIIFKKNNTALKTSIILIVSTFTLVLYATFLTRSGILGNASVHSFTDLGLSGQLLIYLLTFLAISIFLASVRWKEIPTSSKEISAYSREFWIFMGATVLCLMGFQIFAGTSIPVYNKIIEAFGVTSNIAPPAEQALFYSKFQIWGGILIAIISGTGQFFWWRKMDKDKLWNALAIPVLISLAVSAIIFLGAKIYNLSYILLLTAAIYSIIANGTILIKILKKKTFGLSGGAVSHMGIALMLIGILFSAGYSRVVSINKSGLLFSRDMSDEMNKENVLLFLDEAREMDPYTLTYKGQRIEIDGVPGYVKKSIIRSTSDPHIGIAKETYTHKGKTLFNMGDTLQLHPENTYYEVEYRKSDGKVFSLFPRAQANPNMGLLVSPDIKKTWGKDLYTHISSIPDPNSGNEWSEADTIEVKVGEQFFVNDFVAVITGIQKMNDLEGISLGANDVAAKAIIEVLGKNDKYVANPILVIRNNMLGNIPSEIDDLGVRISFLNIRTAENIFKLAIETRQKDYIIMKAIEMPWINILWLGTLVLMFGFGIAMTRRYKEFKNAG